MAGANARQLVGKIQRFDPNECSWTIYRRMLEDFFAFQEIDDANIDIKRAILLVSIGTMLYESSFDDLDYVEETESQRVNVVKSSRN